MNPFSPEDFFSSPDFDGSPGAQLYLYRYLHLLAAKESHGIDSAAHRYSGAKKLAARLQLRTPERLEQIFRNAGLGELQLEIGIDRVRASVRQQRPLPPGAAMSPENTPPAGTLSANVGSCDLERGLLDGALELITGLSVTTREVSCWTMGSDACVFEASRDMAQGIHGTRFHSETDANQALRLPLPGVDLYGHDPLQAYLSSAPGFHGDPRSTTTPVQPGLRSWFMDLASRELARAKRHERELSLLYIDLDDLGEVNQNRGRSAGDQIISSVSSALSRSCRSEDYLWHHGEDEFAVLLSETGTSNAAAAAQRLAAQIRSAAEYVDFSVTVSASIGYSTYPSHANNISELLTTARSALYLAKSLGKGKIQVASRSATKEAASSGIMFRQREASNSVHTNDVKSDETESPLPGAEAISAIISSTSPLLLAGMEQILNESKGVEIVGSIIDPSRLMLTVADLRPEVIFADVAMAVADDYALLRMMEAKNLPSKMVVSVMEVDQDVIKLAADFRIDGIILQSSSSTEVFTALSSIYHGKTIFPDEVRAAISDLENNRRLLNELSEREVEVLRLVAEGKSNSQISDELFITVNTVRFHLANIYQKLMVSNRTEAANYYLRQDMAQENQPKFFE